MTQPPDDRYFIDFPARIRRIQTSMAQRGIDVYLGSRLRTLSWTLDAFCPWRSYHRHPGRGSADRLHLRDRCLARRG